MDFPGCPSSWIKDVLEVQSNFIVRKSDITTIIYDNDTYI